MSYPEPDSYTGPYPSNTKNPIPGRRQGPYPRIVTPAVDDEDRRVGGDLESRGWLYEHLFKLDELGWYPHLVGLWDPAVTVKKDGNGAISTLYDLSGNDNDLTQSTTAAKPTAVQWAGKIFSYDSDLTSKDGTGPKSGSVTTQHSWDGKYGGSVAVDEATTNEIEDSEDFRDTTSWIVEGVTVSADDATAPDGSNNADKLTDTDDASGRSHRVRNPVSTTSDAQGAISVYVKPDTAQWAYMSVGFSGGGGTRVFFDLSNAATGASELHTGSSVDKKSISDQTENGFYRIEAVVSPPSGESISGAQVGIADSDGGDVYQGSASLSFWLWGAQFEEGKSYATSYIPTTGSSASRSAGELKYDKSILSAEEGTIACWVYVRDGAPHDSGNSFIAAIRDGDSPFGNFILYRIASGALKAETEDADENSTLLTGAVTAGAWNHVVLTWDRPSSTLRLYVDGSQAAEHTSANLPDSFDGAKDDALKIGIDENGLEHLNSRIDDLQILKRAWTSSEVSEAFNADSPASEAIRQVSAYDGSDDFLSIGDNADVSTGDVDFFLCGLVRFDDVSVDNVVLGKWKGNITDNQEYILWLDGNSNFKWEIVDPQDDNIEVDATSFGAPSANAWHFLYCHHDAGSDELAISVDDGTLDTTSHADGVKDGTADLRLATSEDFDKNLNGQLGPVLMGKGYIPSSQEITDYKTFLENAFGLSL